MLGIVRLTVCADEQPSIQARQRVDQTKPVISGHPMRVADHYKRMGAVQLFCALVVASGRTFTRTFARKCFAQFKEFLLGLFASGICKGIKMLKLILDNGPTHAPKQLGDWIVSLELPFGVRIFWLPKYASWLDQVEIIFSKVQRRQMIFRVPRRLSVTWRLILPNSTETPVPFAGLIQRPKCWRNSRQRNPQRISGGEY